MPLYLEGNINRLDKLSTKALIRSWIEVENHKQLSYFQSLNPKGGHYTQEQKEYVVEKAKSIGVRATSRLLHLPRKSIQRWLRKRGVIVQRCPDWVYDWAYWKRKRREKWERIMSYRKWRHLKRECPKQISVLQTGGHWFEPSTAHHLFYHFFPWYFTIFI